jgi:hypothetical protein
MIRRHYRNWNLSLVNADRRIDEADAVVQKVAGENEVCRRLVPIPDIGPVTATATIAAIGSGAACKKRARVFRVARNRPGHPSVPAEARESKLYEISRTVRSKSSCK